MLDFSLILGTVGRVNELEIILSSLQAQTYQNFELIVVDQNPDDRLVPILARYKDKFPILHLRSEKGLSKAKNLGLKQSTRTIVGFPDDNCRYPSDLLERVANFFACHPDVDGLTGRSVDENGNDSNGRYDTKPGPTNKFNLWKRVIAYNIFLRARAIEGIWFDERLGPGAGTVWGAADETDYLLRVLGQGASLYYDPDLIAIHASPLKELVQSHRSMMYRAYSYGRGMSHVLQKHDFPLWFRAKWILRALGGMTLFGAMLRFVEAAYYWNALKGRLREFLK
jgi:glycosyltransferase involved in cell wall biosynthesis